MVRMVLFGSPAELDHSSLANCCGERDGSSANVVDAAQNHTAAAASCRNVLLEKGSCTKLNSFSSHDAGT